MSSLILKKRCTHICSLIFLKSSKSWRATERPSAMRLQLSAPPPMNLHKTHLCNWSSLHIGCQSSHFKALSSDLFVMLWVASYLHCRWHIHIENVLKYMKPVLNAVNPGDELKSRAGWSVALNVRLWGTIHCVEDHQSILCTTILIKEKDWLYEISSEGISELTAVMWKTTYNNIKLTSPPKSVSAGGPPLKYLSSEKAGLYIMPYV